jgi:hypothetical protein
MFMTVEQCWRLCERWYDRRLELDYEPPPTAARQAQLAAVGLFGPAWEL